MSSEGYITVSRKILDWKWWHNNTARGLWLYLLMMANWRDGYNNDGTEIKRGQVCRSLRNMADDNGVNIKTIRYWLEKFQQSGEIEINRAHHYNVLTIVNYGKYQPFQIDKGTLTGTPTGTSPGTDRIKKIKKNKENKENNKYSLSSDDDVDRFSLFWTEYPKKEAKQAAVKAFNKACKDDETFQKIMNGIRAQNESKFFEMIKQGRKQYIPNASTWLNGQRWEDEIIREVNNNVGNEELQFDNQHGNEDSGEYSIDNWPKYKVPGETD